MMRTTLALSGVLLATACASNPPTGPVYDPYEGFNRKVYGFNNAIDEAVLVPVAKGYRYITPDIVETGIANFFSNLDDVTSVANGLLQGKLLQSASDTGRFVVNSTAGLLGFLDVASKMGLAKHDESFGQTLGVWGIGEGPFLMLPFYGPNNARSTAGIPTDGWVLSLPPYVIEPGYRLGLTAIDTVSIRASLLSAGNLLNAAALDPYLMLRDFWVERHRRLTVDGERPVGIGQPGGDGGDPLDELDELDRLDSLDDADAPGGDAPGSDVPASDALDPGSAIPAPPLDELDELDRLDALEAEDAER